VRQAPSRRSERSALGRSFCFCLWDPWNPSGMARGPESSRELQAVVLCLQGLDGQRCSSPWTPSPPRPASPWMLARACGIRRPRRTPRRRRKGGQSLQTSSLSVGKRRAFFQFLYHFGMKECLKGGLVEYIGCHLFFCPFPSPCYPFCFVMLSECSGSGLHTSLCLPVLLTGVSTHVWWYRNNSCIITAATLGVSNK